MPRSLSQDPKKIRRAKDNDIGKKSDEPPDPARRKAYCRKSRASAKFYREKAKGHEIDLVAKEEQLLEERRHLDAYVVALKNEVLTLKCQILQHSNCDCDYIRTYIVKAAGDIVASPNSPMA
ncbi:hypothetical protein LZ30DRAFT_602584 [Colletotrichum cereale]|nr:hypothetical protein LZ30DRAFT_602584 [Colletotrichum cereale]